MRARILRVALSVFFLTLGVGSVAYGVWGHLVTVVLKQEVAAETSAPADDSEAEPSEEPEETSPDEPEETPPGDPWMQPPRDPWMDPPPKPEAEPEEPSDEHEQSSEPSKPKEPEEKIVFDLEPIIVRDVTVGGVELSEAGEIFRTYIAGEKPPSLCPT